MGVEKSSDIQPDHIQTYRAAVPGGWLVTVWADVYDKKGATKNQTPKISPGHWGGGLTFVPEPEHRWDPVIE